MPSRPRVVRGSSLAEYAAYVVLGNNKLFVASRVPTVFKPFLKLHFLTQILTRSERNPVWLFRATRGHAPLRWQTPLGAAEQQLDTAEPQISVPALLTSVIANYCASVGLAMIWIRISRDFSTSRLERRDFHPE